MQRVPAHVRETLLKAVQRSRERHSPPIVNKALFRWPASSPNTPGLVVEELEYYVEEAAQGWVPLRIVRPPDEPAPQQPAAEQEPSIASTSLTGEADAEAVAPGAATSASRGPSPQPAAEGPASGPSPVGVHGATPRQSAAGSVGPEGSAEGPGEAPPSRLRRPLLVIMHATGENMDVVRPKQETYARMGYFTVAIDARYHGQRAALPYEVAAALNAALPKPPSSQVPAGASGSAAAPIVPAEATGAVADLVASVKRLTPQTLSALERADAAAGLKLGGGGASAGGSFTAPSSLLPPEWSLGAVSSGTIGGGLPSAGASRAHMPPAPAGSRTAAAEARQEAEAEARRQAHYRFVNAWLAVTSEFRQRRGVEAATAVLATAPPMPAPGLAGGGSHRGAAASMADRVTARMVYEIALMAAWRDSGEQPLFLDTVWDLMLLLDVLAVRDDVDMSRVGVTGFSMGGSITWLWSVIDPRIAVAAPVAGVQGFRWAIENESYHARVGRYPLVFELAASDMRGSRGAQVDGEVVRAVWNKLLPGMLDTYDAPLSLPTIATRPLLVVTGELDQSCPLPGVNQAAESTRDAYLEWAQQERAAELEALALEEARRLEADLMVADDKFGGGEDGEDGWGAKEGGSASGQCSAEPSSLVEGELERSGSATGGNGNGDGGDVGSEAVAAAMADEAEGAAVAAATAAAEEAVMFADVEAAEAAEAAAAAAAAEAAAIAEAERREQQVVEALLATKYRYVVEMGVGHTETLGIQKAVEQWLHIHLLHPWRKAQGIAQPGAGVS